MKPELTVCFVTSPDRRLLLRAITPLVVAEAQQSAQREASSAGSASAVQTFAELPESALLAAVEE